MNEEEYLSGSAISEELFELVPKSDDDFLLESPVEDTSDCNSFTSKRVTYGTIKNDLYDYLKKDFNLCSMAYEDPKDYIPVDHDHIGRYNKIEVEQLVPDDDDFTVLGHIVVDGVQYDFRCPSMPEIQKDPYAESLVIG